VARLRLAPVQRAPAPGCFITLFSKHGFGGGVEELLLADMSLQTASSLAAGNLVMLTNIGVSSSGELLNCNAFDVAHPQQGGC
jgi:hypothetical protein